MLAFIELSRRSTRSPLNTFRPRSRFSVIALAALGLAFRGASLSAQQVAYTAPGTISLTGVPMIYNGQYAIQKTDFGFLF